MDISSSKGLCVVLLFVDTLLFGCPPYLLVRNDARPTERSAKIRAAVISYLTCFAGGVFFGVCMLHLLVEGREEMENYFTQARGNKKVSFPAYEIVVAAGFFLITLIEQIAHRFLGNSSHNSRRATSETPDDANSKTRSANSDRTKCEAKRILDNPVYRIVIANTVENSSLTLVENHGVTSFTTDNEGKVANGGVSTAAHLEDGHVYCKTDHTNGAGIGGVAGNGDISHDHGKEENHDHSKDAELARIAEIIAVNPLRAFLLLAALSFHTVFDGLAVGLQTESDDVWEMFIAICIHKSLVALCLGMQLFLVYRSKPIKAFIWIFVFSLISPIGVGLGIILTSGHMDKLAESLVSWILQALATGTFMYVTFFEILWEELVNKKGILRLLVVILGFGSMAVSKYFDKD